MELLKTILAFSVKYKYLNVYHKIGVATIND